MSKEQPVQTLAVFILDNDGAAKAFLKVVQKIDDADKNVKIVDAAIADKTKRGRVKIHQTEDTGALKGGLRGGAIGLVVGAIVAGPAGPLVWGAAGGILAGLHNRFRDIGIDDKFMKRTAAEVEKGKSALFVLYEGDWSGSIGAIEDAIKAQQGAAHPEHPAAGDRGGAPGPRRARGRGARRRGGHGGLRGRDRAGGGTCRRGGRHRRGGAGRPDQDLGHRAEGIRGPRGCRHRQLRATWPARASPSCARSSRTRTRQCPGASAPGRCRHRSRSAVTGRACKAFNKQTQPAAAKTAAKAAPEPDDLTNLAGIGPKAAKALAAAGITTYRGARGRRRADAAQGAPRRRT